LFTVVGVVPREQATVRRRTAWTNDGSAYAGAVPHLLTTSNTTWWAAW